MVEATLAVVLVTVFSRSMKPNEYKNVTKQIDITKAMIILCFFCFLPIMSINKLAPGNDFISIVLRLELVF